MYWLARFDTSDCRLVCVNSFQMPHPSRLRKPIIIAWKPVIQTWAATNQRQQIFACSLMRSTRWVPSWNVVLYFDLILSFAFIINRLLQCRFLVTLYSAWFMMKFMAMHWQQSILSWMILAQRILHSWMSLAA